MALWKCGHLIHQIFHAPGKRFICATPLPFTAEDRTAPTDLVLFCAAAARLLSANSVSTREDNRTTPSDPALCCGNAAPPSPPSRQNDRIPAPPCSGSTPLSRCLPWSQHSALLWSTSRPCTCPCIQKEANPTPILAVGRRKHNCSVRSCAFPCGCRESHLCQLHPSSQYQRTTDLRQTLCFLRRCSSVSPNLSSWQQTELNSPYRSCTSVAAAPPCRHLPWSQHSGGDCGSYHQPSSRPCMFCFQAPPPASSQQQHKVREVHCDVRQGGELLTSYGGGTLDI